MGVFCCHASKSSPYREVPSLWQQGQRQFEAESAACFLFKKANGLKGLAEKFCENTENKLQLPNLRDIRRIFGTFAQVVPGDLSAVPFLRRPNLLPE
jgi:hypothetical protein